MRSRPWLNRLLMPVAVLLFYFLVPVSSGGAPIVEVLGFVVAFLCVGVVAYVVASEVRRSERRLQPVHLLLGLELVLIGFALGYYVLSLSQPEEFTGLHTRLDALYFSLTTMSTVGYGDISAAGQTGRLLVAVQLAFNLVFVAALVGLFQDGLRARADHREPSADSKEPDAQG